MDQRIQRILTEAGAGDAQIESVRLYKNEQRLSVTVRPASLISVRRMEQIKHGFMCLMPGCTVETGFAFPDAVDTMKNDFDKMATLLRACWCDYKPTLRPALAGSIWSYANGRVSVRVNEALRAMVDTNDNVRGFAEYIKKLYNLELCIDIRGDETIALPADAAQHNEVRADGADKTAKNSAGTQKSEKTACHVIMGREIKTNKLMRQVDVQETMTSVLIQGEILSIDVRQRGEGGCIMVAVISDHTNSTPIKLFLTSNEKGVHSRIEQCKSNGEWLVVKGRYSMDQWLKRMCVYPNDINYIQPVRRMDDAQQKRVELHLHTKMSSMDGLVEAADAVKTAARWGHKAVAITDHGVVQAFPQAVSTADKLKKNGIDIKVILGVEGYLLPDCEQTPVSGIFVAIGINSTASAKETYIYELAAVRFDREHIIERINITVNPGVPIDSKLQKRTGLTDDIIADGIPLREALSALHNFMQGAVPVAHGKAQYKLIADYADRFGLNEAGRCVDTAILTHYLERELNDTGLEAAAKAMGINTGPRAADAAQATAALLQIYIKKVEERGASLPLMDLTTKEHKKGRRNNFHIIIIAQNHEGLKNLYRLVSYAHLEYLKKVPQIPKSLLMMHREGLIIGSACEAGEVFRAILEGVDQEKLEQVAAMYDYLEIQPTGNNEFLVREGIVKDKQGLQELNCRIVELGEQLNKPVVGTGDVHFLEPEDAIYRAILMHSRDFKDAEQQAPLYFKTTDEMLEEFSYLGESKAREVVIDNPNAIADMCEVMKPFLDGKRTYAPTFPGANEELSGMAVARAHELYGDVLPDIVQARLDRELNSIIGNGYASLYLMAQRLVKKSLSDGYLVGSRGSVGSSLVATLAGITEVNSLPPHYVCSCRHSEFDIDRSKYACGVDMPDKVCPVCGKMMGKAGYDIPFEVFLGFKGDKTPDIDLNFSGEYQSVAHKYTETMFGTGHAFRAGTISGIQDKTAYGYVKNYCEEHGIRVNRDEIDRLVAGCTGVKRTTGQHPGGIVIVPEENDIMEFTPVQYPADKSDTNTITTHFDFHALDDRLVKLDILGHDDPTVLRMLEDITGLNPRGIPLDDPDTMRLFSSAEPLGVSLDKLSCDVGSLAIPEFGTAFVRQMLMDTRPTTMEELVRISGLSHGTDVWVGNAQDLVRGGTATLSDVICTRDDIMNYLIAKGGDPSISFKTMENVRKGRGLTPDMEQAMRAINVPDWFMASCKKIQYMFPRAHAAAYVMMAFRVAYYKVHYPAAFYAVYFTVRADAFDLAYAQGGSEKVLANITALRKKGNDIEPKEEDLLAILEIVYEMNLRGIELLPLDLYKSAAKRFVIEDGALRPPFSSVAGVGGNAAEGIAAAQATGKFTSVEDFRARSKANSAVVSALIAEGCLSGLPESNQISLF
ncbi:MAG: PolC-type DNA polymerase III [Clostridia bacterium]